MQMETDLCDCLLSYYSLFPCKTTPSELVLTNGLFLRLSFCLQAACYKVLFGICVCVHPILTRLLIVLAVYNNMEPFWREEIISLGGSESAHGKYKSRSGNVSYEDLLEFSEEKQQIRRLQKLMVKEVRIWLIYMSVKTETVSMWVIRLLDCRCSAIRNHSVELFNTQLCDLHVAKW